MFGNKEGWLVSVAIVAVVGLMLWKFELLTAPGIARPSGQFKDLREPIALPVKPEEALAGVMTEDRDAGDLYWKAIKLYQDAPETYENKGAKYTDRLDDLKAVDLLVDATAAKQATIFLRKPELIVNYKYPWPEMDALFEVGRVANSIAFSFQARGDEAQTKKYAHASFSLGAKLYNERITHGELDVGIKLMQGAGDTLRTLAKRQGDKAGEERWQKFGDATSNYYKTRVLDLYRALMSEGLVQIEANAGDVFELARHNDDRMWKVESLLRLGRYKYNATRKGDQIGARRMLSDDPTRYGYQDWTKSPDPAVKAAALAAKKLTVEEYRTIE
jgi:hypothetical protein